MGRVTVFTNVEAQGTPDNGYEKYKALSDGVEVAFSGLRQVIGGDKDAPSEDLLEEKDPAEGEVVDDSSTSLDSGDM